MAKDVWDYSQKGQPALIRAGAYDALRTRGWDGCDNPRRDGERGVIAGRFNPGKPDDHIGVRFDDGAEIGFPPNFVVIE